MKKKRKKVQKLSYFGLLAFVYIVTLLKKYLVYMPVVQVGQHNPISKTNDNRRHADGGRQTGGGCFRRG